MTQATNKTFVPSNHIQLLGAKGADTILFAGTTPFLWSFNTYLQQLGEGNNTQWFVTVHLVAQGDRTVIFRSETVEVLPNVITTVPFPGAENSHPLQSNYYMESCAMFGSGIPTTNCVYLQMIPSQIAGYAPSLVIVGTQIQPTWIIGAREIILTDPPVLAKEKRHTVEEVEVVMV